MQCVINRLVLCPFFVSGALAGGITKKVKSLLQTNYLKQLRSREVGRGGGGRF